MSDEPQKPWRGRTLFGLAFPSSYVQIVGGAIVAGVFGCIVALIVELALRWAERP
jgi:hypothetical protein